jgi:hypothetical protein
MGNGAALRCASARAHPRLYRLRMFNPKRVGDLVYLSWIGRLLGSVPDTPARIKTIRLYWQNEDGRVSLVGSR